MQKKLIALAVASLVSAPVFAQSQVTVYGTFDAGVRSVDNANLNGDRQTTMDSSGTYNSNRWGIKGSEDLGNGMKANFNLEGGFLSGSGQMDDNNTLFRRKAIVGLSGNWGALDLGRNYTTIFYTTGAYDPFNYKYTGIIPIAGLDGARRNNTITYTGAFNGLTVRAMYALGETVGSGSEGSTSEVGASYANGPFSVGAAYGVQKSVAVAAKAAVASDLTTTPITLGSAAVAAVPALDTTNWTIGGAYKTGPFRVALGYDVKEADVNGGGSNDTKVTWVGGSYDITGPMAFTLAYYKTKLDNKTAADGDKKLWMAGLTYDLSKRTTLYTAIDNTKLDGSYDTGTKDTVTGISIGMNHAF
ncbi:MAG: porin [Burkholderiales bacterium]|nr:porin [Burkholderiales bacterium]